MPVAVNTNPVSAEALRIRPGSPRNFQGPNDTGLPMPAVVVGIREDALEAHYVLQGVANRPLHFVERLVVIQLLVAEHRIEPEISVAEV